MSIMEWVLCGGLLLVLIVVAIKLCRRPNCGDCACCPLRKKCAHPVQQEENQNQINKEI